MLTPSSSLTFLGFVTELVLQDLPEQEKSDTAKHSLGEKVSWYSTGDDVAGNDRFVFVLFHGRERAEDEYKEGNQRIKNPQIGAHETTRCRYTRQNASKSPSRTGGCSISTAAVVAPEY